jgi:hypothetical protein
MLLERWRSDAQPAQGPAKITVPQFSSSVCRIAPFRRGVVCAWRPRQLSDAHAISKKKGEAMTGLFATLLVGMVVGLAVGVAAGGVFHIARVARKAEAAK